jgi:hypothetical protein
MAARMKFIQLVKDFWRDLWRQTRIKHVQRVSSMSEVPSRLKGTLYIVGSPKPKWAVLDCPCGCRERINVNLMESRQPAWSVLDRNGGITLRPSLWVPADKCGSHFFIENNQIRWV